MIKEERAGYYDLLGRGRGEKDDPVMWTGAVSREETKENIENQNNER